MRSNVRNYYKPKQKDAFFDVEGVVNKDTLLFRNEFHGYIIFRRTNSSIEAVALFVRNLQVYRVLCSAPLGLFFLQYHRDMF